MAYSTNLKAPPYNIAMNTPIKPRYLPNSCIMYTGSNCDIT